MRTIPDGALAIFEEFEKLGAPLAVHDGKISFPKAVPAALLNRARQWEPELVRLVARRDHVARWKAIGPGQKRGQCRPMHQGVASPIGGGKVQAGYTVVRECGKCDGTGHLLNVLPGKAVRCECLVRVLNEKKLGFFYCPDPVASTPLSQYVHKDLCVTGSLQAIRRHVARVLLDLSARDTNVLAVKAYRLVEISFQKDHEFDSVGRLMHFDLLVLLLGWGHPRHGYLHQLVNQLLARRSLEQSATWVVLGAPLDEIKVKYSREVYEQLRQFPRVEVVQR